MFSDVIIMCLLSSESVNKVNPPRSVHCERVEERVYQGTLASSRLGYLNKALSHIYNWQRVSGKLAICTACEKGRQAEPRALQHVLRLTRCGRGQNKS